MKKWLCLILAFSLCACDKEPLLINNKINQSTTQIDYSDEMIVAYNDKVIQVFDDTNGNLLEETSFNNQTKHALTTQGCYLISLDKNKVDLVYKDGSKTTYKINSFFQREKWLDAWIDECGEHLYYITEDKECMVYDFKTEIKTCLADYQESWKYIESKDSDLYFICLDTNKLLKYDGQIHELASLEDAIYYDEHVLCTSSNQVYYHDCQDAMSIKFSETIVDALSETLLTIHENNAYVYQLETGLVYTLDFKSTLVDGWFKTKEDVVVQTSEDTIETLSLRDAKKVNVIMKETRQLSSQMMIDAPLIAQRPNYPTGCETISAMMLLGYIGEDLDTETFIDDFLETSKITFDENGMHAANPYHQFVGDPRSAEAYGCMASVIEKALIKYYGEEQYVVNTTGLTLNELCINYIQKGYPVLVWASISMIDLYESDTWTTPEGEKYTWLANEHCLLLVGYDEQYYYFNDPWTGTVRAFSHSISEKRYETLGMQSLTVLKK